MRPHGINTNARSFWIQGLAHGSRTDTCFLSGPKVSPALTLFFLDIVHTVVDAADAGAMGHDLDVYLGIT